MGRTLSELDPEIQIIKDSLDTDFLATGVELRDKAESVKAKLGAPLTDRIKKFDLFYEACRNTGRDLT